MAAMPKPSAESSPTTANVLKAQKAASTTVVEPIATSVVIALATMETTHTQPAQVDSPVRAHHPTQPAAQMTVMSQGKESKSTIPNSATMAIAIVVITETYNEPQIVAMAALSTATDPTVSVRTKSERTTPIILVSVATSVVVTLRRTTLVASARLLADTVATHMQTVDTASVTVDTQQGKNTASARHCTNVT